MRELVFLLEEESAKVMLDELLPRLIPGDIHHRCIPFQGKQDLEKQIVRKIRAYQNPEASFVILRDLDSHADCKALKTRLMTLCSEAGHPNSLVRIACRELETFYLADLAAVEKGLGLPGLKRYQQSAKFRSPDHLGSPSKELSSLTKGRYQKVSGSRAIGPWLDLENDRSASFRNLVAGIRRITQTKRVE